MDFKPTSISEIIGNLTTIKQIENWLKNFQTKKYNLIKPGLFLRGPHGCGKTTFIKLLAKKYNYNYLYLTPHYFPSKKDVDNFVEDNFETTNALTSFFEEERKMLILDELENLNNNQKYFIEKIQKFIQYPKKKSNIKEPLNFINGMPVIFISNNYILNFLTIFQNILKNIA